MASEGTNLHTLYVNLKEQNFDVPDTYDSFERTLCAPGKEGTNNRLILYKNLKEQNFDVPDTYDSFARTLFTSATPKPAQQPVQQAKPTGKSAGQSGGQLSPNNRVRGAVAYVAARATGVDGKTATDAATTAATRGMAAVHQTSKSDGSAAVQAGNAAGASKSSGAATGATGVTNLAQHKELLRRAGRDVSSKDGYYMLRRGGRNFVVGAGEIAKAGGLQKWAELHPGAELRVRMTGKDAKGQWTDVHVPLEHVSAYVKKGYAARWTTADKSPQDVAQYEFGKRTNDIIDELWSNAEQRQKKDTERAAQGAWDDYAMLGGGREQRVVAVANQSFGTQVARFKNFDLQRMAEDTWSCMQPNDRQVLTAGMEEALREQYKNQPEKLKDPAQLRKEAEEQARKSVYMDVYNYAVRKQMPKGKLDLFMKQIIGMNSVASLSTAAARSAAGTGDDLIKAQEAGVAAAAERHPVTSIAGTVVGMAADPVTTLSAGAGAGVSRVAMAVGGRIMLPKATAAVAGRAFALTRAGKWTGALAASAGNFATFEGVGEAVNQLKHGGYVNTETGETEDYSVREVVKKAGHGAGLGLVMGAGGVVIGNAGNHAAKAVERGAVKNPTLGAVGITGVRALEKGASVMFNGTVFAADGYLETGKFDLLHGVATDLGFKVGHGVKSAGQHIAGMRKYAYPRTVQERVYNNLSFAERWVKQLGAKPDMQLTKDELEELRAAGYPELGELFASPKAELQARVRDELRRRSGERAGGPDGTDGQTAGWAYGNSGKLGSRDDQMRHGTWERAGSGRLSFNVSEFDGYEAFGRLMEDTRVSEATRAKLYWAFSDRSVIPSTVVGYRLEAIDKDGNLCGEDGLTVNEDGSYRIGEAADRVVVCAVNGDGNVVKRSVFKGKNGKAISDEIANINRQAELNAVVMGEQYRDYKYEADHIRAAMVEVANMYGSTVEAVAEVYNRAKREPNTASTTNKRVAEEVDRVREGVDIEGAETAADIRGYYAEQRFVDENGDEFTVDVNKALRKPESQRSEAESKVIADYINALYEGVGKNEAQEAVEAEYRANRLLAGGAPANEAEARAEGPVGTDAGDVAPGAPHDGGGGVGQQSSEQSAAQPGVQRGVDTEGLSQRMQAARQRMADADAALLAACGGDEQTYEYYRGEAVADFARLVQMYTIPDEIRQAVLEYASASAAVKGLKDGLGDLKQARLNEGRAEVRAIENREEPGAIVPVKLKSGETVYVVGGHLAQDADGAVDLNASSDVLVVYSEQTRGYVMVSADEVVAAEPRQAVDDVLQAVEAHIAAEFDADDVVAAVPQGQSPDGDRSAAGGVTAGTAGGGVVTGVAVGGGAGTAGADPSRTGAQHGGESVVAGAGEQAVQSALERIPVDEKGEPQFEQAPDHETAWDGLLEAVDGAEADAADIAQAQIANIEAAIAKHQKNGPKLSGTPMQMAAQKKEYNNVLNGLQGKLDAWKGILGVREARAEEQRAAAEAARLAENERLRVESQQRFEAQQREEARKNAEQQQIGANAVSPEISQRWQSAPKINGDAGEYILPDGESLSGRYVLVESGYAAASHDPNNNYEQTVGFPADEHGLTVNDRDYRRDKAAQNSVEAMAREYDGRAIQTAVVVSRDGVVLSGNNRTMSGNLAAALNTDRAYIDYLRKHAGKYGFSAEQIDGMQHPRLVFELDKDMPYTARTFARFNASETKGQSKPEKAVKAGKTMPDETFDAIAATVGQYDSIGKFYADGEAVAHVVGLLLDGGVILEKDKSQYVSDEYVPYAEGRELIENVLVGKSFEGNDDAVRQMIANGVIRESVVMALVEIARNRTLAKAGYDLTDELSRAIDLVSRAKAAHPDKYKRGVPVSPFGMERGLFDDEYGDSSVTDAVVLLLADLINSSKPSDLRANIAAYNKAAEEAAGGQMDIFSGEVPTKEDILNKVTEQFRNANTKQRKEMAAAAVEDRKQRAEGASRTGAQHGEQTPAGENAGGGAAAEAANEAVAADAGKEGVTTGALANVRAERRAIIKANCGEEFTLSDESANNGEVFMQDSNGNTNLANIQSEIFDRIGIAPVPFKLTETMAWHVYNGHKKELKFTSIDDAIKFILNIVNNVDHVRLGRDNSYIFSVENGRKKLGLRAITIVINSETGEFMGIRTSGYEGVNKLKERPLLWERGTLAAPEDVATPTVTTIEAQQGDERTGRTESQSKGEESLDSVHKVNTSSPKKQETGEESSNAAADKTTTEAPDANTEMYWNCTITKVERAGKNGAKSEVYRVEFDNELSPEEKSAVDSYINGPLKEGRARKRGWYDEKQGVYMMRSKEAAEGLDELISKVRNGGTIDEQPLTKEELEQAAADARDKQPVAIHNEATKVADVAPGAPHDVATGPKALSGPAGAAEVEVKTNKGKRKLVITDEMKADEDIIRSILGISDEDVSDDVFFRDGGRGLTPEEKRKVFAAGVNYALRYIDQGIVDFEAFASAMVGRLTGQIKPWLKAFYNGARDIPGYESVAFTPYEEVVRFDVANFDRPDKAAIKQAEMALAEHEAKKIVKEGEKEVKKERAKKREEEIKSEAKTAEDKPTGNSGDDKVTVSLPIASGGKKIGTKAVHSSEEAEAYIDGYLNEMAAPRFTGSTIKTRKTAAELLKKIGDAKLRQLWSDWLEITNTPSVFELIDAERRARKMSVQVNTREAEILTDRWRLDLDESNITVEKQSLAGDSKAYAERRESEDRFVDEIGAEIMTRAAMPYGRGPLDQNDIKRIAAKYPELKDISITDLQELVELSLTKIVRDIAAAGVDGNAEQQRKAYDRIVQIYQTQPRLSARDSERLKLQQYSTPTPLGYLGGLFLRSGGKEIKSGLEPSAGNGALTVALPPEVMHVNDIDQARLANLRKLGCGKVTARDALLPFGIEAVDAVMTNPPFGTVTVKEYDGIYKISSLEGQMAINALDCMADDGRAFIIIGGNTSYRSNGSMNTKDAALFGYLYSHYNVVDVINISGNALYSRNGTDYDVRMILIDGRKVGEFKRAYPPVKAQARAEQVTTFDELYNRIQDDIRTIQQVGHSTAGQGGKPRDAADGKTGTPVRGGSDTENGGLGGRPGERGEILGRPPRVDDGQSVPGHAGAGAGGLDNGHGGNAAGADDVRGGQAGGNNRPTPQRDNSLGDGRGSGGGNRSVETADRPDTGGTRLDVDGGGKPAGGAVGGGKPAGDVAPGAPHNAAADNLGHRASAQSPTGAAALNAEKLPYPKSSGNGFDLMSVVPANQVEAIKRSLSVLGDVDDFIVGQLGYSGKDELYDKLAAEQIDSVALAINQMNQGKAFIIGDMTGVGKGRQGAALIRYAVKSGKVPVYFTQKATLFSDNYRDLCDIGSGELRPFVIASDPKNANITDQDGNLIYKLPNRKEQRRVFDHIAEHGTLPPEYDFVLTTYSQIQNGTKDYEAGEDGWQETDRTLPKKSNGYTATDRNGQERRDALLRLAEGNIVILDESHSVSGDSGCSRYMQSLTAKAHGVTFMSATFAKRPDNMPIYAQRTAISEGDLTASDLIQAVNAGGVTLQELMSKQLVESGQMIRRERSFEGVTINWLELDEDTDRKQRQMFDEVADIFNGIRKFQEEHIKPEIEKISDAMAATGGIAGLTAGTEALGVKNVPFASKMYNLVNQLLFSLKVDAVADRAIKNLQEGRKPIISFTNTMEGFLKEAVGEEEMDEMPNFSVSLLRALDGVMRYTEKDADANSQGKSLQLEELSEEGQQAYESLRAKILNLSADLPISPMDAIRIKLEQAGYSVGEITGRKVQLSKTENGKYRVESRSETDKKAAARDFNAGKLDVLLINKSGSTGISLHASSKFADQRQRVMIFAQFQMDINDEIQMRGRPDRTGQVMRAMYEYIVSSIPAERRLQMMFKAKLKSLDANTTSSQKSKFNEMEIADFLNKYGDQVVTNYMLEHPELCELLDDPLNLLEENKGRGKTKRGSDGEDEPKDGDAAAKLCRYLPFLSVDEQDVIFDEIAQAYNVKMQALNEAGENDLEITSLPLNAQTKSRSIWHEGTAPGSGNAFADHTYLEEVEADVLKKPMKRAEVEAMTRGMVGDEHVRDGQVDWDRYIRSENDKMAAHFAAKADERLSKMQKEGDERVDKAYRQARQAALRAREKGSNELSDADIEQLAKEAAGERAQTEENNRAKVRLQYADAKKKVSQWLPRFHPGVIYVIPEDVKTETGGMTAEGLALGTFVGFKFNKDYTVGSSTAVFATLDGRRKVEYTLKNPALEVILRSTENAHRYQPKAIRGVTMDSWDSRVPTQSREKRYILTGNLLQALADMQKSPGVKGQLVKYTDRDGNIRHGILMNSRFKPDMLSNSVPISSRLEQLRAGQEVISEDESVRIGQPREWRFRGDYYELRVPKSKQRGGKYTMNDRLLELVKGHNFISSGNSMAGLIHVEDAAKVLDLLSKEPFNVRVKEKAQLTADESAANDPVKYRIRTDEAPKKTGIGYKVFVLKDGKLYPPMVANADRSETPTGVWLDADANEQFIIGGKEAVDAEYSQVQPWLRRYHVQAGGKGTQGGSGTLAYRPGWHLGEIPYALQFGRLNPETGEKELFPGNFVWAEVEYAADVNYQRESDERMWYDKNGKRKNKPSHALGGLNHVPDNGYYNYRTNPNPETDPWIITGAMKVKRLLPFGEVDRIVEQSGRKPQQRQAGGVTDEHIGELNRELDKRMNSDRGAMKEHVSCIAEKLGVSATIITDEAGVSALDSPRRRRAKGWYDPAKKEIVVVLPNHTSVADAEQTIIHEAVAHHGLRKLVGEDKIDTLLDEVHAHAADKIKADIDRRADEERRRWIEGETRRRGGGATAAAYATVEAEQRRERFTRTATEEYMADMAEKIGEGGFEKMSREEQTLWGRIKAKVQKLIDGILRGLKIGKSVKLSDKDLAYILYSSWKNLRNGGGGGGAPTPLDIAKDAVMREKTGFGGGAGRRALRSAQYSDKKTGGRKTTTGKSVQTPQTGLNPLAAGSAETGLNPLTPQDAEHDAKVRQKIETAKAVRESNERFNSQLERYIRGEMPKSEIIQLGSPLGVLRSFMPNHQIVMRQRILHKGSEKKHNVELSELRDLPKKIAFPIFIFQRSDNNLGVLTEIIDRDGKNVCVAIELGKAIQDGGAILEVNDVRSIHGREIANIVLPIISNNTLRYVDKQKGLDWLSSASTNYQQEITKQDLESAAKVVKDFENPVIEGQKNSDEVMYRGGSELPGMRAAARERYERRVASSWYQTREAMQDSMLGLLEVYKAIEKANGRKTYIEDVADLENAYTWENRYASRNKKEQDAYRNLTVKSLSDAVAKLAPTDEKYDEVLRYVMAKHGLERNALMRQRDIDRVVEAAEKQDEMLRQKKMKKDIDNGMTAEDAKQKWESVGFIDIEAVRQKAAETYGPKDYGGLTGLMGEATGVADIATADAEAAARDLVDNYESDNDRALIDDMWSKINAATKASLSKLREGGLLSKQQHDEIAAMYDHYVPLRGWAETTADEVYGYLTRTDSELRGDVLKKADGRSSVADDPIATIALMGEQAIMKSNRNMMKQAFLNYVQRNPSDLVSVNRIWLAKNDDGEWELQWPKDIKDGDSGAVVEAKLRAFQVDMMKKQQERPEDYATGRQARNIPYKIGEGKLKEHMILVRCGADEYIMTVNGNPRAAQAINGLSNPDSGKGWGAKIFQCGEVINRWQSQSYTARHPEFIPSNFVRDIGYGWTMTPVKEGGKYAAQFFKNSWKVNPIRLAGLISKYNAGELDINNPIHKHFNDFMKNGGETGYSSMHNLSWHKKNIDRMIKESRKGWTLRKALHVMKEKWDIINGAAENCARFAAYLTSREAGRSIGRSIYDAKEISVNFNKKGAGATFMGAEGQTAIGNAAAFIAGAGPGLFIFWKPTIQAVTGFLRNGRRHPGRFSALVGSIIGLGLLQYILNRADDDDDDNNNYINQPDYVRRGNIMFKAEDGFITIPIAHEYRAPFAVGNYLAEIAMGDREADGIEIAEEIVGMLSEYSPVKMENASAKHGFIPSAPRPIVEAYVLNESWTGLPIYKDTPYNQRRPEWTKAYKSANPYIVALMKGASDATGGDNYKPGWIDFNPARAEYLLNSYLGGPFKFFNKCAKTADALARSEKPEARDIPFVGTFYKYGDERTAARSVNNDFYKYMDEYEGVKELVRGYERETDGGVMEYAQKLAKLSRTPEFKRYWIIDGYRKELNTINDDLKEATSDEEAKKLEDERTALRREIVGKLKGKVPLTKADTTGIGATQRYYDRLH